MSADKHSVRCVDEEGKVDCVCGLDEARQRQADYEADRLMDREDAS